jgi:hypothetical protein
VRRIAIFAGTSKWQKCCYDVPDSFSDQFEAIFTGLIHRFCAVCGNVLYWIFADVKP